MTLILLLRRGEIDLATIGQRSHVVSTCYHAKQQLAPGKICMGVKVQFGIDPCRKRKIRCKKPETRDVLNRCESCINLKKDCIYAPVSQQAPLPTTIQRPRRMSVGVNPTSPSTASPTMAMDQVVEGPSNPTYHQLTAMSSMPSICHQPAENGDNGTCSAREVPSTTPNSRSFSYGQGTSGWMHTDADVNTTTTSGDTTGPWMTIPHGLPDATEFSQYAPQTTSPLSTWPANSLGIHRVDTDAHLDHTWRPYPSGARSMSFNNTQSGQFDPSPTRPYDGIQSPSAADIMPEVNLHAQGSLSAGATPSLAYDVWQQQYQYSRLNEEYNGWYENGDHPTRPDISSSEGSSQTGGTYYRQR
ncbi:uncharacterized protein F4812DRAFT_259599 [Daldinia caldariorum]|uniref:uncharacterized protein n=1 Tax=Daldinia caldariorum TaxID=326644 RepID=UPI0020073D3D|nr:uncharacterized protein F4812DRAFT_259599 [Daldinia caldariorum]KAI1470278.1 hypothetical protein F4812DRAFT_259599 [Daldinia caldariorum]